MRAIWLHCRSRAAREASGAGSGGGATGGRGPAPRAGPLPPCRCSRLAGMTLVEVLVATVILGIGLVGVGSMVTCGVIAHQKARIHTIVASRAVQEIERIRDSHYVGAKVDTSLFPAGKYTVVNATQVTFEVRELRNGSGVITLEDDPAAQAINPGTGQPYGNLKVVKLTIGWDGRGGARQSYQVATQIANRP